MKVIKIIVIPTSVVVLIFLLIWKIGLIGLWTEGMAYIANNTSEFTDTKGHIVNGEYSIPIDLSNL